MDKIFIMPIKSYQSH